MDRSEFEVYLAHFNGREYERAMDFFAEDIVLKFAGYTIKGKNHFMDFYRFFHHYVDEKVLVQQFAGDEENVIIDVVVKLMGREALTSDILKANGYERLVTLAPEEVKEIAQFIQYRIEQGKFKEIRCVIKG